MRWIAAVAVILFVFEASAKDDTPAVNQKRVPPGENWWCYQWPSPDTGKKVSKCTRTQGNCKRAAIATQKAILDAKPQKCSKTDKAAVFTAVDRNENEGIFRAYLSTKDCELDRGSLKRADYKDVSRCEMVGKVDGTKFAADSIPTGKVWFCMSYIDANGVETSTCFRDLKVCKGQEDKARDAEWPIQLKCKRQTEAFAVTGGENPVIYMTEQSCMDQSEAGEGLSACTRVP